MARLRRFLMLERARRDEAAPSPPTVSSRFEALSPPPEEEVPEADPFAPRPDPVIALEVQDVPERVPPARDGGLAAEIDKMTVRRKEMPVAQADKRHARQIDRLADLIAVGPLARLSPRARAALVGGLGAALIGGLFFVGGIGPRVLQIALGFLLAALFIRS